MGILAIERMQEIINRHRKHIGLEFRDDSVILSHIIFDMMEWCEHHRVDFQAALKNDRSKKYNIAYQQIFHEPAECHKNCNDQSCPYMHTEAWSVGNRLFSTLLEAQNYVDDCVTAATGDDITRNL